MHTACARDVGVGWFLAGTSLRGADLDALAPQWLGVVVRNGGTLLGRLLKIFPAARRVGAETGRFCEQLERFQRSG